MAPLLLVLVATDWLSGHSDEADLLVTTLFLLVEILSGIIRRRLRTSQAGFPAPTFAEFFLYLVLPRRQREPILGDLNEDFTTNILPRFGPLLAEIWHWCKAMLCISMYTCENAIEPSFGA
jgi:hypothetical protein